MLLIYHSNAPIVKVISIYVLRASPPSLISPIFANTNSLCDVATLPYDWPYGIYFAYVRYRFLVIEGNPLVSWALIYLYIM